MAATRTLTVPHMDKRPNITLKQLEALYWSANLGTFAAAADRLAMTQSALSKRILELELEVGAPLFDRTGGRARITEAGARILAKAEAMLNMSDEIMLAARGGAGLRGACRFGLTQLIAFTSLPALVGAVRRAHPEVVLEPRVAVAEEALRDVLSGETDFALAPGRSPSSVLATEYVRSVELAWVSSPRLLPGVAPVTLETLQHYPVISMSAEAGSTLALNPWAQGKGVTFQRVVACNSPEAVAALTIAGLGISLLARPFAERFVPSGELCLLPVAPEVVVPDLDYYLHWRTDNDRLLPKTIRDIALDICRRG
jgi:DNA-binding transcriptional LysR family regulator